MTNLVQQGGILRRAGAVDDVHRQIAHIPNKSLARAQGTQAIDGPARHTVSNNSGVCTFLGRPFGLPPRVCQCQRSSRCSSQARQLADRRRRSSCPACSSMSRQSGSPRGPSAPPLFNFLTFETSDRDDGVRGVGVALLGNDQGNLTVVDEHDFLERVLSKLHDIIEIGL